MQQGKVAMDVVLLQPVQPVPWQQPAHPEQPWARSCSSGQGGHGSGKNSSGISASLRAAKHILDIELSSEYWHSYLYFVSMQLRFFIILPKKLLFAGGAIPEK